MYYYNDILILTAKSDSLVGKTLSGFGVDIESMWKNDHFSVRKFKLLSLINKTNILYGFTKQDVESHNKIIISENNKMADIIEYIRKYNNHCIVKVYLWTPVNKNYELQIKKLKSMNVDIYSFDEGYCKKYNLYYNHQPVSYLNRIKNSQTEIKYDCYFCGSDKNRILEIIKIKKFFINENISFKFRILLEKSKNYNFKADDLVGLDLLKKEISYDDILEETKQANCILELLQKGQTGYTLRTMEALYLDKKLITNNKNIKNYDFYNPNNIFILDNNYDKIKHFLELPYELVPNNIKERYSFKSWIENFFGKEG